MNLKSKFKRLLSAILSFAVIGTALPSTLAVAEEVEKYPYSVFGRNGITVSASSNLCIMEIYTPIRKPIYPTQMATSTAKLQRAMILKKE